MEKKQHAVFSIHHFLASHRAEAETLITEMKDVTGCLTTQPCPLFGPHGHVLTQLRIPIKYFLGSYLE